jgi:RimJ/RimL family protein N-acetyltransferase
VAAIEPKTAILKNGKEVCIRTPVADDVPKVLDYLKVVFQDDRFFATTTEEAQKWQVPETEREHIEKCYKNVNKLLVVTVADDRIVSFSNIDAIERKRSNHVGQLGISILPDYRNNGLGTAIMQTMIDWATAHPVIEKLALGVWATNMPAIGLYEKMGFVEEGRKIREVKYADGSYDDCVCMCRFVMQT